MRNAGGYACIFGPEGVQAEMDTFTCKHCNTVIRVEPKCSLDDLGGMCRLCMKMICPTCVDLPCIPFEKRLAQAEARDRAIRSYG